MGRQPASPYNYEIMKFTKGRIYRHQLIFFSRPGDRAPGICPALVNIKETYDSMAKILKALNYTEHGWQICADLKVIGMLTGMQPGFTKFCYFLCEWENRDKRNHYEIRVSIKRKCSIRTKKCKKLATCSCRQNNFAPLHIKLGLMKKFVKAIDKPGKAFQYLGKNFKG